MENQDWHRARIIAEIRMRCQTNLSQLSIKHGFDRDTLKRGLDQPYLKAELIIAIELNEHPKTIWPSRYPMDGKLTKRTSSKRIAIIHKSVSEIRKEIHK